MKPGKIIGLAPKLSSFLYHYQFCSPVVPYKPPFVFIEPTNLCNYRCTFCPHSDAKNISLERGYMSMELFEDLIGQIQGFKPLLGIALHMGGEPLLHPKLTEMVLMGKTYGLFFHLSSNGSLLIPERTKELVDAGLERIVVDFSANKELYEESRPPGKWDAVYENLRNLMRYKTEANSAITTVIKDISFDNNASDNEKIESLNRLKELFEGLPVSQFEPYVLHNWSGEFAKGFQAIPDGPNAAPLRYTPCSHPWSTLNITWDGKVVPCCRDLERKYLLGDANNESLLEIWNGKRMVALRKLLAEKRYDEIDLCRHCDRLWTGGKRGGKPVDMAKKFLRRLLKGYSV